MQTVRQIERLWNARQYGRLFRELLANRPECSFRLGIDSPTSALAAAIGIVRLDELNQSHVPLYSAFIRAIIASQEKDGGWGDAIATTLCLRALMLGRQTGGEAIQRGLKYLADLQKSDGTWPRIPFRRMPGDAGVSAFVLYELGDETRFREAVRFEEAMSWFQANQETLDAESHRLWERAQLRCPVRSRPIEAPAEIWS
jgi:hypothetical protein